MKDTPLLYRIALRAARAMGSPLSIILHTCFFVGIFSLGHFGYSLNDILLILTTVVSLEAIYLSIFIQMAVNATTLKLEAVRQDVEEIQEDVEDIQEDVEDISEDVEEISEDVEDISEEREPNLPDENEVETLLKRLAADVEAIKTQIRKEHTS